MLKKYLKLFQIFFPGKLKKSIKNMQGKEKLFVCCIYKSIIKFHSPVEQWIYTQASGSSAMN